jgi:hypothetical protein
LARISWTRDPVGMSPAKVSDWACLVHREDRAHEPPLVALLARAEREGEEQPGGGQAGGAVAEVALVELERGAAVELVEDVALGARHEALGPKMSQPPLEPWPTRTWSP